MFPEKAEKLLGMWNTERFVGKLWSHFVHEVFSRRPTLCKPSALQISWAWMIPFLLAPQLVCPSLGGREVSYFISVSSMALGIILGTKEPLNQV